MRDPRLTKLADVLVNYSVAVRPGQLVRIGGSTVTRPLVAELYRAVVAAGGNPFVRVLPEDLKEILIKNGSDEQIKYVNPIDVFEYEKMDCYIGMWGEENTRALSNCDTRKIGLTQTARKPLLEV